MKKPWIKIIFTALPRYTAEADGLGAFLPQPVDPAEVVAAIGRHLGPISKAA